MPRFDFSKKYRLFVPAAPAPTAFAALERYDIRESRTAQVLMFLRGYGRRARPAASEGLVRSLIGSRFVHLGVRTGREHVFGLAGRFWTPGGGLRPLTAEEFLKFAEEGYAKAAWNLAVEPAGEGASVLSTETRILCFGTRARRFFGLYWHTIELFSGAIRLSMLRGIRAHALADPRPD